MLKLIQFMDAVSTDWTAKLLYRFLSHPKKHPIKTHESVILAKATARRFNYNGKRISGYQWGQEDRPKVLLIHGWEGRAGNFGKIVEMLVSLDYCVFAYDGPAHGLSDAGNTSMFRYAHFVKDRIEKINPKIIITHSFGSVPTLMAFSQLENLNVEQLISITTPYDFRRFLDRTMKNAGISDKTKYKLIDKIEKKDGVDISTLNMQSRAHQLKVKPKITIVHSQDDKVLPITESQKTQKVLPNAKLYALKSLGHYSVLWAEETIDIIRKAV